MISTQKNEEFSANFSQFAVLEFDRQRPETEKTLKYSQKLRMIHPPYQHQHLPHHQFFFLIFVQIRHHFGLLFIFIIIITPTIVLNTNFFSRNIFGQKFFNQTNKSSSWWSHSSSSSSSSHFPFVQLLVLLLNLLHIPLEVLSELNLPCDFRPFKKKMKNFCEKLWIRNKIDFFFFGRTHNTTHHIWWLGFYVFSVGIFENDWTILTSVPFTAPNSTLLFPIRKTTRASTPIRVSGIPIENEIAAACPGTILNFLNKFPQKHMRQHQYTMTSKDRYWMRWRLRCPKMFLSSKNRELFWSNCVELDRLLHTRCIFLTFWKYRDTNTPTDTPLASPAANDTTMAGSAKNEPTFNPSHFLW